MIHCTELPDLATAREYGEKIHYPQSGSGHSGHYYIDRDGRVEQWVPTLRTAHHARDFNARSIGIELVNTGRYPDWLSTAHQEMTETYPDRQIESLMELLHQLLDDFPQLRWIAGHEDLDRDMVPASDDPAILVRRKLDPGPMFPWDAVSGATALERWPAESGS